MTSLNEVTGQQATPAAEFDHETILFADTVEQREDPRRARVCVKAEAEVVYMRQIGSVERKASLIHAYPPCRQTVRMTNATRVAGQFP
jgi:hypothetical protein